VRRGKERGPWREKTPASPWGEASTTSKGRVITRTGKKSFFHARKEREGCIVLLFHTQRGGEEISKFALVSTGKKKKKGRLCIKTDVKGGVRAPKKKKTTFDGSAGHRQRKKGNGGPLTYREKGEVGQGRREGGTRNSCRKCVRGGGGVVLPLKKKGGGRAGKRGKKKSDQKPG